MRASRWAILALIMAGLPLQAATITVTTKDNASGAADGLTSLKEALATAVAGDTIAFNIPGAGPQVIETPVGGYQLITRSNLTIDGYSQPGSTANTQRLREGNNAKIMVVLDSSGAGRRSTPMEFSGYGTSEDGILSFFATDNVTIRGLCFLGKPTAQDDSEPAIYSTAFIKGSKNCKIQGCWFGLPPNFTATNDTQLKANRAAVAAFRYREDEQANPVDPPLYSENLVFGTDGDGTNDLAERNVCLGMGLALACELPGLRVSGNYFNVYPDGKTFVNIGKLSENLPDNSVEIFENGRLTTGTVFGTNGDGKSDADEGNICGAVAYDHYLEFYGPADNVVVAGNNFGVGIDDKTTYPHPLDGTPNFYSGNGLGARVGTNGDGVSDALEGNQMFGVTGARFAEINATTPVAARGNIILGSGFGGFPFPEGQPAYEEYYVAALADPANPAVKLTASPAGNLAGTVPAPVAEFPHIFVDVYLAAASTDGAAQLPGSLLASAKDNGTGDLDAVANKFSISLNGLGLAVGAKVVAVATYSKDANKTEAGRSITGIGSAVFTLTELGAAGPFVPKSSAELGSQIVVDTAAFKGTEGNLDNWEPNVSVLGEDVFLIEANRFADGSTENQNYGVAFQKISGGAPVQTWAFYGDDGKPFTGQVNLSRQNGNPGRVAGDKRPGATTYMSGGEASPHAVAAFGSNNRWKLGFNRLADGRYATVQLFTLDSALAAKPASLAFDAVNSQATSGEPPSNQISRFGGEIAALDNGNFVIVVADKSAVTSATDPSTTATIVSPTGTIITKSFTVADTDIWSNLAPFKGGFCVRAGGQLYFYDNTGKAQGDPLPQADTELAFDAGRGDGVRIASHINSTTVFLAGKVDTSIQIAAFDAVTRKFLAATQVNEFEGEFDRVNLAVDALTRVAVAYEAKPLEPIFALHQIALRVLSFDATAKKFAPLGASMFAFKNTAVPGKSDGIRTVRPSVAMTTKAILVAAKGEINLANDPTKDADSPTQTTVYTVLKHPDPKDDPTPRATPSTDPTLALHLSFDGDVNDASGKGLHGSILNGAALSADVPAQLGKGQSLELKNGDGVENQGVRVPANAALGSNVFTLAYWIKPTTEQGNAGLERLTSRAGDAFETGIGDGNAVGGSTPLQLSYFQGGWQLTDVALTLNKWTHVAWKSNADGMELFVDGASAFTGPAVPSGRPGSGFMNVGTRHNTVEGFEGFMDDLRLYSRDLSSAEIKALAAPSGGGNTGGTTRPNLISQTRYGAGAFGITLQTTAGAKYDLEYSQDMKTWTVINLDVPGSGNPLPADETNAERKARKSGFYRVRVK